MPGLALIINEAYENKYALVLSKSNGSPPDDSGSFFMALAWGCYRAWLMAPMTR